MYFKLNSYCYIYISEYVTSMEHFVTRISIPCYVSENASFIVTIIRILYKRITNTLYSNIVKSLTSF